MITAFIFYICSALLLLAAFTIVKVKNMVYAVLLLIFCFFDGAVLLLMTGAEFISMLLVIAYVGAIAVLFLFVVMMLDMEKSNQIIPNNNYTETRTMRNHILSMLYIFCNVALFMLGMMALMTIVHYVGLFPETFVPTKLFNIISQGDWMQFKGEIMNLKYSQIVLLGLSAGLAAMNSYYIVRGVLEGHNFSIRSFIDALPWGAVICISFITQFIAMVLHCDWSKFGYQEPAITLGSVDIVSNNTYQLGMLLYTKHFAAFQMAGITLFIAIIGAIVLTLRQRSNVKRQDISRQNKRKKQDTLRLMNPQSGKGVS